MALYPDNMTYEEMMEELARLVTLMLITDEQNDSSIVIDNENKNPESLEIICLN